jgi:hypothetical protein
MNFLVYGRTLTDILCKCLIYGLFHNTLSHGRSRCRWEDNTKLKEERRGIEWNDVAQDRE